MTRFAPGDAPIFIPKYAANEDLFPILRDEVKWERRGNTPRQESFMAAPGAPRIYSYGNNNETRTELHTYEAVDMHPRVLALMEKMNSDYGTEYNICVLNSYKDGLDHLGWHADDSPEQDLGHPIAVIAFGAERYIWVKEKTYKGPIPDSQKYLMTEGSLFVMPAGFQGTHLHRIPKHDRPCGGRISLTYRKLVR